MKNKETLEEAAEKYSEIWEEPNFKAGVIYGVIEGAKWQQEQDKKLYSEEDFFAFDVIAVNSQTTFYLLFPQTGDNQRFLLARCNQIQPFLVPFDGLFTLCQIAHRTFLCMVAETIITLHPFLGSVS